MNPDAEPQPLTQPEERVAEDLFDAEGQPQPPLKFQEMNNLAVASVVFGALSILTTFSWIMIVFPLAGISLALVAMRQIKRASGEMIGREFAVWGLWLSIGLWALGTLFFFLGLNRGAPWGYQVITFEALQPEVGGDKPIPKAVTSLKDEKVYIRGYMYPGRRSTGIKEFLLVPTEGHCNFCSRNLKSTEVIQVNLEGDMKTNYRTGLIGVGGRLRVDEKEAGRPFGGTPYKIDSDCIR
jgi:hypothetical protein